MSNITISSSISILSILSSLSILSINSIISITIIIVIIIVTIISGGLLRRYIIIHALVCDNVLPPGKDERSDANRVSRCDREFPEGLTGGPEGGFPSSVHQWSIKVEGYLAQETPAVH